MSKIYLYFNRTLKVHSNNLFSKTKFLSPVLEYLCLLIYSRKAEMTILLRDWLSEMGKRRHWNRWYVTWYIKWYLEFQNLLQWKYIVQVELHLRPRKVNITNFTYTFVVLTVLTINSTLPSKYRCNERLLWKKSLSTCIQAAQYCRQGQLLEKLDYSVEHHSKHSTEALLAMWLW